MKTNKLKIISLLLFMTLACITGSHAQDVVYSQFYANPLYLNPALAGSKICNRLTVNYRNQWPGISKGFVSYSATWDQYFEKLSGGLGVIVTSDVSGGGLYNRFSASGIYSYRLQVSRYIVMNAALQAGYMQYKLDWSKLLFEDQVINLVTGKFEHASADQAFSKNTIGNIDFSAGVIGGYRESLYLGIAVNHLSRPDLSLMQGGSNNLNLRWTIHSGMLIDFDQGMYGEDIHNFSLSPNVVYMRQGSFQQLNMGMYVNMYPLVFGLWMRQDFKNPDGVIALLGLQQRSYKIGYSYDYTISRLTNKSGGAHEITMAWLFNNPLNANRYHEMRSPTF